MGFINTLGVAGVLLFFIKIGIHIYIKRRVDKKFHYGAFGQFTNLVLFFPITDQVRGRLKLLKIVGNIGYLAAIVLILVFVVGVNLH